MKTIVMAMLVVLVAATAIAADYKVANRSDFNKGQSIVVEILVPYKSDWTKIGETTKEILDKLRHGNPKARYFRANVTFAPELVGTGTYLAFGEYARDGKGANGSQGYTWLIRTIDPKKRKLNPKEFKALKLWCKMEKENPMPDEKAQVKKIAHEVGLSSEKVERILSIIYQPSVVFLKK